MKKQSFDDLIWLKITKEQEKFIADNFKVLYGYEDGMKKYVAYYGKDYELVEEKHIKAELNPIVKKVNRDFFLHTFILYTDGFNKTSIQSVPQQKELFRDLMKYHPSKEIYKCLNIDRLKTTLTKELKLKTEPKKKVMKI